MIENHNRRIKAELPAINKMAENNLAKLVINSEEGYKRQVRNLAKQFLAKNKRFILLSGPSSAGKTTTSNLIRKRLEGEGFHSIVISLDNFFVDREKTPRLADGSYDFENITALDLDYYNIFLGDLLEKGKANMPEFDFMVGKRKEKYVEIEMDANTIVIFEGIHALNPLLISEKYNDVAYRVYLSINTDIYDHDKLILPGKELRLMRRILRDHQTRGHSVASTLEMWPNVLDGEEKYIKPYKKSADFVVNTMHFYEPLLYASYLLPLLESSKETPMLINLKNALKKCYKISKDCVPKSSLLWEFLVV